MSDANKSPREKYETACRVDQLKREGLIGKMIANALSIGRMSPDELFRCLMSEPYCLPFNNESFEEILKILNNHKYLLKVSFNKIDGSPAKIETFLEF